MNRPHQRGPQGVRQDRWSGSKVSKRTAFAPWSSHCYSLYRRHRLDLESIAEKPHIIREPPHDGFLQLLSEQDVREVLASVPQRFMDGLEAVFLLGGFQKLARVQAQYCYGMYSPRCASIFLAPYPRAWLSWRSRRPLPHVLQEYRRVGAKIENDGGEGVRITFTEEALREFYLRDVLPHGVGHHVDREGRHSEGFAKWFAVTYGPPAARR